LRAIWGLWAGLLNNSELRAALTRAETFAEIATRAKPADRPVGDRMIGYILHLMGDQTGARRHIERMLDQYVEPVVGAEIIRFVFDQRATARCFLARILWLQGHADQAMRIVDEIVDTAVAANDTLSLCQALVQAGCPLAILVGDLDKIERFVRLLLDHSTRNSLEFWQVWGRCFEGVLVVKRGESEKGAAMLGAALAELRAIDYGVYYVVFLGEYAEALGRIGKVADGLLAIKEAIKRCERNEEKWFLAELLRIEAELTLLKGGKAAAAAAERRLSRAIEIAREQQTIAWELRTATSLARLWKNEGRTVDARGLVASIHARFSEGLSTADERVAMRLIEDLDRVIAAESASSTG
jgi:predicted ATPase